MKRGSSLKMRGIDENSLKSQRTLHLMRKWHENTLKMRQYYDREKKLSEIRCKERIERKPEL